MSKTQTLRQQVKRISRKSSGKDPQAQALYLILDNLDLDFQQVSQLVKALSEYTAQDVADLISQLKEDYVSGGPKTLITLRGWQPQVAEKLYYIMKSENGFGIDSKIEYPDPAQYKKLERMPV